MNDDVDAAILLGICRGKALTSDERFDPRISKVGGEAAFFTSQVKHSCQQNLFCGVCGQKDDMTLICQVYCPTDEYDRSLYIFACISRTKQCSLKSLGWKVFRNQILFKQEIISKSSADHKSNKVIKERYIHSQSSIIFPSQQDSSPNITYDNITPSPSSVWSFLVEKDNNHNSIGASYNSTTFPATEAMAHENGIISHVVSETPQLSAVGTGVYDDYSELEDMMTLLEQSQQPQSHSASKRDKATKSKAKVLKPKSPEIAVVSVTPTCPTKELNEDSLISNKNGVYNPSSSSLLPLLCELTSCDEEEDDLFGKTLLPATAADLQYSNSSVILNAGHDDINSFCNKNEYHNPSSSEKLLTSVWPAFKITEEFEYRKSAAVAGSNLFPNTSSSSSSHEVSSHRSGKNEEERIQAMYRSYLQDEDDTALVSQLPKQLLTTRNTSNTFRLQNDDEEENDDDDEDDDISRSGGFYTDDDDEDIADNNSEVGGNKMQKKTKAASSNTTNTTTTKKTTLNVTASATEKQERLFQNKCALYPRQVLRYSYGGYPLWCTLPSPSEGRAEEIPLCKGCGAARVFEMQVMPALLSLPLPTHTPPSSSSAPAASEIPSAVNNSDSAAIASNNTIKQLSSEATTGFDFGVVAVWCCPNSCPSMSHNSTSTTSFLYSEYIVVQPPPDVAHTRSSSGSKQAAFI